MVEPLFSPIKLTAVTVCLVLAACARPAPELPSNHLVSSEQRQMAMAKLSPQDRALTCKQITNEQKSIAAKTKKLNDVIKSDRDYNQAANVVSGMVFPPAALAVSKHHKSEKEQLDALQKRKDHLIFLYRVKAC